MSSRRVCFGTFSSLGCNIAGRVYPSIVRTLPNILGNGARNSTSLHSYLPYRTLSCESSRLSQNVKRFWCVTIVSARAFGSIPCSSDNAEAKPDFKLLTTPVPTMFTCTPLDPSLVGFSRAIEMQAAELFSLPPAYVPPKELNYQLPERGIPEIAFVGRSNVGKSTLVGTLLGDKSLVRISKSPGCTQSINYFSLTSRKYGKVTYLVDLPGYGYARASKDDRQKWMATMEQFLNNRSFAVMRRVFLLVDSRRGVSDSDRTMMDMLNKAGLTYQIVLTKTDCVSRAELLLAAQSCYDEMRGRNRHACVPTIHAVSAKEGKAGASGIATLKAEIASIVYMDFSSVVIGDESTSGVSGREDSTGESTHK